MLCECVDVCLTRSKKTTTTATKPNKERHTKRKYKVWNVYSSEFRVGKNRIHAVGWKLFAFNHWPDDFHHHWALTVSVCVAVAIAVEKNLLKTEMCAGFYAVSGEQQFELIQLYEKFQYFSSFVHIHSACWDFFFLDHSLLPFWNWKTFFEFNAALCYLML